ncbi:sodium-dependent bicarbonate transport family permease [Natronospira bacteriovora]|uniref:Sodium-dependent bicarbonate transport family permease n=1 Tax=Natronospira bacteriovora TaxID=3069753 RepID=A0ABU0W602_9GAMM|nr:sodium-dependent bicarbonate transport family permease [Natronospira sp. AB-CW4]MDQ2068890.1 sodium-dependent bicarbonate transport family permease [Natronospira sp. AB-CW4]
MGIDPIILFFILGILAGAVKADLHLPKAVYELLTVLLLLSIGLKGGVELADSDLLSILPGLGVIAIKGVILGLIAFAMLRLSRKLPRADAASIAAHYGSVSVGTFAVAMAYLEHQGIPFEAHAAAWVVVLEVPAILLGVVLVRGLRPAMGWAGLSREVFLGKGVVLLLGGLFIGLLAGPAAMQPLEPLFFDAFRGVLALFLLEMGLVAASRAGALREHGLFIAAFGLVFPLVGAAVGTLFAWMLGLSLGGAVLLVTLSASASYIAAPAAMRLSVPEANPSLSLTASLALTFPFNVIVGIPLYHYILSLFYPGSGG